MLQWPYLRLDQKCKSRLDEHDDVIGPHLWSCLGPPQP